MQFQNLLVIIIGTLGLNTFAACGKLPSQTEVCENDCTSFGNGRWSMPLVILGEKQYYFQTFFKANWYQALQYCRFHGMDLVSITCQEENEKIIKYVADIGLVTSEWWTSGTDQGKEGSFVWVGNGRAFTYSDFASGQPDNAGNIEHCVELWNRETGMRWNDRPCAFLSYFICEVL